MNLLQKLEILSDSAKYDASCSSSGSVRKNTKDGIGNAMKSGICHSFTKDGRCVSLLKILMTNNCIYDCKYCLNRRSNNLIRTTFTPEEICELTINFYKRNYIEGLFLSSGIIRNPDYTMEKLIETVTLLRKKYKFNGYIHCKVIPGSSENLIKKLESLVDRVSVNVEMPSKTSLELLAPDKNPNKLVNTIKEVKKNRHKGIGQSTQLVVGATKESDYKIMTLSESMYDKFKLNRVYYSAYVPVNKDELLPRIKEPNLVRENRLYQADWLIRYYGFTIKDLLSENENFNPLLDPKSSWALKNLSFFPVEINKSSYKDLLKVPGIGVKSAKQIITSRKLTNLTFEDLKKMNVVLKRAKYFITCNGEYFSKNYFFNHNFIEQNLINKEKSVLKTNNLKQLSLFE